MPREDKIVVTGAAGHLGSHIIPLLVREGYCIVGIDMADKPDGVAYEYVQMELSQREKLGEYLHGAALIVHTASLHPWKSYNDEAYLDANIKGTWQLYSAAAEAGVPRIVLTSSIAAVGYHAIPTELWPLTEERETPIGDLYSLTKHTQEDIAKHFAHVAGVCTIALRPPAFMPKPDLDTGFLLTGAFSVVDDIAGAHLSAVKAGLGEGKAKLAPFEAFFTVNALPYTAGDTSLLENGQNVRRLVEKYWPSEYKWLVRHGYSGTSIPALYDISKAFRILGWKPKYNFEQWAAIHIS